MGESTKTKFRASYFPFTEPSVEVDAECNVCKGAGCPACKGAGQYEILGAGMIHPRVLELNGIETEEFVVSNGTPCDNYYEVLDALTINPVVVKTIIRYMNAKFETERNDSGKITFETSMLYEYLKKLESEEFKKSGLSLFDLAMLLKVSSPAAEFDKKVGKDIMKEALAFVYDYMKTIVLGDDLDWVYGNFVYEQAMLFDKNVDWYYDNWKDNFSGYVDDLLQIAANDIENKKLKGLHQKMQDMREKARKRRE